MSEPVYSSNSYVTLRKAAIAGRGVAVLPIRLVGDELADGTLVTVLPECDVPDRPLYALHSPGTQTTARVRLFLDFVSDWFRKQARSRAGRRSSRHRPSPRSTHGASSRVRGRGGPGASPSSPRCRRAAPNAEGFPRGTPSEPATKGFG